MSLVGHTIQQYRVLEQLGQGGMAVVYKAYDTRLERDVAVKVIRRAAFPEEQLERILKRFEREAKALARLQHPNIVGVMDYGEYDGSPYLVMEYLPGGTLKAMLGHPLDWAAAVALLLPIARAVQYAHDQGLVHRDIKPGNILITQSGEPMLTDFGIAKLLEAEEGYTLTGTGMGVGTPDYMAPEQWAGDTSPRSDIYSLGVVLYELVTGRKPFTADTPAAILLKQATEALPLPRQFAADLPEMAEKVILKALALKPADRYESMAAFGAALTGMTAPAVAPSSAKTAAPEKRPAPKPEPEPETRDEMTTDPILGTKPARQAGLPVWAWVAGGIGLVAVVALLMSQAGPRAAMVAQPTSTALVTQTLQPTRTNTATPTRTRTPAPTPTLGIGSSYINPIDGARLFYIPAGDFVMGSYDGNGDERPVHTVYLDAYWMYETEVTNAQFAQFVAETSHRTDAERAGSSYVFSGSQWNYVSGAYWERPSGPSSNLNGLESYPVIHVSWNDAAAYCEWAGGRLPTEAEWEKAARGRDGRTYPWGNGWNSRNANSQGSGDGYEQTAPVGSFPGGASPFGLQDMAGNVWEWVADWYGSGYYSNSPASNPQGPGSGEYRVLRGGSWFNNEYYRRSANRFNYTPANASDSNGFRCASSPGS